MLDLKLKDIPQTVYRSILALNDINFGYLTIHGQGGKKMIEDGLFDDFSIDEVYALHNWPDLPLGSFGVNSGPMMAAVDEFDIIVKG